MISTTALSSSIGVHVRGVADLEEPTAEERGELRRLFDAHHLLLFRGRSVSEEAQVALCRSVRRVAEPKIGWISNVEDGFHPEGKLLFHTDFAFTRWPLQGISLFAVEVGEGAAPTTFVNTARAAATLPPSLRDALADLSVVHVGDTTFGAEYRRTERDQQRHRLDEHGGEAASRSSFPRYTRPALWSHPITGIPLLFVNEQQASHFQGWSCDESDELLEAAFAHLYDEATQYAHEWQVDDLVIWDNIALQHGRPRNPHTVRRSLRRVIMADVTKDVLTAGTGFAGPGAEAPEPDAGETTS